MPRRRHGAALVAAEVPGVLRVWCATCFAQPNRTGLQSAIAPSTLAAALMNRVSFRPVSWGMGMWIYADSGRCYPLPLTFPPRLALVVRLR